MKTKKKKQVGSKKKSSTAADLIKKARQLRGAGAVVSKSAAISKDPSTETAPQFSRTELLRALSSFARALKEEGSSTEKFTNREHVLAVRLAAKLATVKSL